MTPAQRRNRLTIHFSERIADACLYNVKTHKTARTSAVSAVPCTLVRVHAIEAYGEVD
jgi:hypothetical protein